MAVAFQATSAAQTADGVTSITYSMTVSAGSDLALAVGVAIEETAQDVSSVAFNGDALTQVNADVPSGGSFAETQLFRLVNPDVVTGNVVVTLSAADSMVSCAVSMTGVDQTTPVGTAASAVTTSGTSLTATTTDQTADDLLVDMLCADSNVNVAEGANQTNRGEASITGRLTGAMSTQDGADGGAMSWSWTGARTAALIAVAFKASGAAAQDKMRWLIGAGVGGRGGTNLRAGVIV